MKYMHNVKNRSSSVYAGWLLLISVPSTDIDWVATTLISQEPLMPFSSGGLFIRTVTAVKKAYITAIQQNKPANHNAVAYRTSPATITSWLPTTHVAATTVKNPGPRTWSFRSESTRGKKRTRRTSSIAHSAANIAKFV